MSSSIRHCGVIHSRGGAERPICVGVRDVYPRQPIPEGLQVLAGLQAGVITREQAIGHGLSPSAITRLVRTSYWQRIGAGVYATSSAPISWTAYAWAGVLIGGDRARLGGMAAWHLHGLEPTAPELILTWVPGGKDAPRVVGPWIFRREGTPRRLSRSVGSPPRLRVEETLLDLLPGASPEQVVGWVTAAVQQRRTSSAAMRVALNRRPSVSQRQLLTELLAETDAGVRSPLELTYRRDVEQAHHLPSGRRQRRRRHGEVDVDYEEFGLLVELDGRLGHEGLGRFRDMRRDNLATTGGLATLRYGHRDVYGDPCAVAWQVSENLVLRGWSGFPSRCHRCRRVPDVA